MRSMSVGQNCELSPRAHLSAVSLYQAVCKDHKEYANERFVKMDGTMYPSSELEDGKDLGELACRAPNGQAVLMQPHHKSSLADGHYPLNFHPWFSRRWPVVGFFRNPVSRLVSMYSKGMLRWCEGERSVNGVPNCLTTKTLNTQLALKAHTHMTVADDPCSVEAVALLRWTQIPAIQGCQVTVHFCDCSSNAASHQMRAAQVKFTHIVDQATPGATLSRHGTNQCGKDSMGHWGHEGNLSEDRNPSARLCCVVHC